MYDKISYMIQKRNQHSAFSENFGNLNEAFGYYSELEAGLLLSRSKSAILGCAYLPQAGI
jgi:hypothetical protein